jgi:hypothetical protein
MPNLLAPFPYFGGKRLIVDDVWRRLGTPDQYIEPFCGSAAMLLGASKVAPLEVICDGNGFIANFWRATKYQPQEVARWADYPVSHIDLGASHIWLMEQRERIGSALQDIEWPGDAKAAGRWLWGQCCWIGSGWCDWNKPGQVPHTSDAGRGVQAIGQVPHTSSAGRGYDSLWTSSGRAAWVWLHKLADRLERVRIVHGDWTRCLNNHFGGERTAVFLDPPYLGYEEPYGAQASGIDDVVRWARDNGHLRIALCGHVEDYDLSGWEQMPWSRGRLTYGGGDTTDKECVWFSPPCEKIKRKARQLHLFEGAAE